MTPSQRPEPVFLCPMVPGHADRLRGIMNRAAIGAASVPECLAARDAVRVLLSDREAWDQYVTEDTQERMRYLFQNQEDLPMEALVWIAKTSRGEPTE